MEIAGRRDREERPDGARPYSIVEISVVGTAADNTAKSRKLRRARRSSGRSPRGTHLEFGGQGPPGQIERIHVHELLINLSAAIPLASQFVIEE